MIADINIPEEAFLPCYRHLLNNGSDIDFYYGGRDSGKSEDIAQQLIFDCLRLPYFKCLLIRKTLSSVAESQYDTLKKLIDRWGLNDLFVFKENPITITCLNNNKFLARGCDNPDNIKSTKDPSHTWIEEGNQLTLSDFITITTSIRAPGITKQRFSFNPECEGDYKNFWLYKTFFEDKPDNGAFKWVQSYVDENGEQKEISYNYTITKTTYKNNPYCKRERIIFLERLKDIDPYFYKIYTLGNWGNRKVGDPFCYAFNKEVHAKQEFTTLQATRAKELYLSFDFNKNPITCGVYQHSSKTIRVIESIKLENSDIYKLCDHIKKHYPGFVYIVTGDATGRGSSALVQDGINYYTVIKSKLNLTDYQIKAPRVNPDIKDNRVLVNVVFNSMDVQMNPAKCQDLIFDCSNVEVDDVGKIDKGDRSNPKKRADHLDHFRYYLNSFHKKALQL